MKPHQKINHFPGMPLITNKLALSTSVKSKYILPSFEMPIESEKFRNFTRENPDKKFVRKNFANRNVRLFDAHVIEFVADEDKYLKLS
jgi:hypothetical protein